MIFKVDRHDDKTLVRSESYWALQKSDIEQKTMNLTMRKFAFRIIEKMKRNGRDMFCNQTICLIIFLCLFFSLLFNMYDVLFLSYTFNHTHTLSHTLFPTPSFSFIHFSLFDKFCLCSTFSFLSLYTFTHTHTIISLFSSQTLYL